MIRRFVDSPWCFGALLALWLAMPVSLGMLLYADLHAQEQAAAAPVPIWPYTLNGVDYDVTRNCRLDEIPAIHTRKAAKGWTIQERVYLGNDRWSIFWQRTTPVKPAPAVPVLAVE